MKILAVDGNIGNYSGYNASISGDGNNFIAGAYRDDDNGIDITYKLCIYNLRGNICPNTS
ncbi:MAG: hypothetical protein JXB88_11090 [Spirochaetales bacterium]|nr:hypothetical protein [Spirochaetales bacterium]